MKTLVLIRWLIIGLFISSSLFFETACRFKSYQDAALESKFPDNSPNSTPTPSLTQSYTSDRSKIPTPSPAQQVKWNPSEYLGITPGKSTYDDVIKILGKPRLEGSENEEDKDFEKDPEFNALLEYSTRVDVTVGKKTKIVKSIGISYPDMKKQEAIDKYGSNYFENNSGSSCFTEDQKRGPSGKQNVNYPISLVYPEKGMTIVIAENNDVVGIWFLNRCDF